MGNMRSIAFLGLITGSNLLLRDIKDMLQSSPMVLPQGSVLGPLLECNFHPFFEHRVKQTILPQRQFLPGQFFPK